jgi:hypothetical protein
MVEGTISKVKEALRRRTEQGEVEEKEQKTFGVIRLTLYKENAYKIGKDGEKNQIGGDANGNYDRICRNLGIPDNDPDLLIDILDVLSKDIAEGTLKYIDEPNQKKGNK